MRLEIHPSAITIQLAHKIMNTYKMVERILRREESQPGLQWRRHRVVGARSPRSKLAAVQSSRDAVSLRTGTDSFLAV